MDKLEDKMTIFTPEDFQDEEELIAKRQSSSLNRMSHLILQLLKSINMKLLVSYFKSR